MTSARITNHDNDHCNGHCAEEIKRLDEQWERDGEVIRQLRDALYWIAELPTDPRPDGTFNVSRAAIIDMARDVLKSLEGVA